MGREEPSLDREARGSLSDAVFGRGRGGCCDSTCLGSSMEGQRKQGIRMLKQLDDDTRFY